jgi:hypothetical protein
MALHVKTKPREDSDDCGADWKRRRDKKKKQKRFADEEKRADAYGMGCPKGQETAAGHPPCWQATPETAAAQVV